jgi:hypothetical protein
LQTQKKKKKTGVTQGVGRVQTPVLQKKKKRCLGSQPPASIIPNS